VVPPPTGDAQPRLIADLLRPEAYAHPADDLRLHETHSSWVVLAGPYAYKLKKPVDLGFLNFTTVEARRADCEEEVRLNRRFSPDVYLGLVEITQRNGRFHVGGDDGSGEPAVWMRRLPEDGMLPHLLVNGGVDARLARRIGRKVASFHASAATGPGVDEYGSLATVAANWDENFVQMEPFVGRTLSTEINDQIRIYGSQFFDRRARLFDRRVADGRIRDGHGDLHAASICVDHGRIYLFDSLQFAPRFRCGDVAAEVAFLAMDFEHHGRADLGWAFVDEYVTASGDRELLALLDFYSCYRAYVRGKVRSLRLMQSNEPRIVSEASAYFDLAWSHACGLRQPYLLVAMGLPASGKTTLANGLAQRLGTVHISSDMVRKGLARVQPTEHRGEAFRHGMYDQDMTMRTYAALRRQAARWLRRGRSVVLDATYGSPRERRLVRGLAKRLDVPMRTVLCHADDETLKARLVARASESGVISDARVELWPELRAAFEDPGEDERVLQIDATRTAEEALGQALAGLRTSMS
jgi:aminoglycoside phosphotransferase family enzyme/predicted kinase